MKDRQGEDAFSCARERMLACDIKRRGIGDRVLLDVMGRMPREEFVPEKYKSQAYSDGPLPIGEGQTISQPYIVALMTRELCVNSEVEILEIGTGSGYQTAILSRMAKRVYTVETIASLSEVAQAILGRMGIDNVEFRVGDGSCGWPEQRSFDRIIVTAAMPSLPQPLIEQLVEGGIMVAPVGSHWAQELVVCEKIEGQMRERAVCDVRFVKLCGEYGFKD